MGRQEVGKGARAKGREAEIKALTEFLPREGFTEIVDLSGLSNQFFIDFVATFEGRRVLVDATVKLKAYFPHKARMAAALRMPLYFIHVAPNDSGLYFIGRVPEGQVVQRVPARFFRDLL